MKCSCGKECGIRIWCEECEAKAIREVESIGARVAYLTKRFTKKTDRIMKKY